MKITSIADPHSKQRYINWRHPEDRKTNLLMIAGDISMLGNRNEVQDFFSWLYRFPADFIVLVAGNHDLSFDPHRGGNDGDKPLWLLEELATFRSKETNFYLENSGCEIEGIKIWGSPITPWFFGETWAFNEHRGSDKIGKIWEQIPEGTDIIITHGPPFDYGDFIPPNGNGNKNPHGMKVGCLELANKIKEIKPALSLFGHIHEGYGFYSDEHTIYLNSSVVDARYQPVNHPWVFNYDKVKNGELKFEFTQGGLGKDSATGEKIPAV
jgi:Icc-related predicted phosphoesterase